MHLYLPYVYAWSEKPSSAEVPQCMGMQLYYPWCLACSLYELLHRCCGQSSVVPGEESILVCCRPVIWYVFPYQCNGFRSKGYQAVLLLLWRSYEKAFSYMSSILILASPDIRIPPSPNILISIPVVNHFLSCPFWLRWPLIFECTFTLHALNIL